MESQPLVSVIMPCYNMEKYISEAIVSVRQQTYPHWELLIVDDASTDATEAVIESHCQQDDKIRFTKKDLHSGIADSRNLCIKMAQGQYLAFLDADDVWQPKKLETQLAFMTKKRLVFLIRHTTASTKADSP